MKHIILIIIILITAINVFGLGRLLGVITHEPQTCDGYRRLVNELQVEKELLIIEINKQDE